MKRLQAPLQLMGVWLLLVAMLQPTASIGTVEAARGAQDEPPPMVSPIEAGAPVDLVAEGLIDAPDASAQAATRTLIVSLGAEAVAHGAQAALADGSGSAALAPGLAELGYRVLQVSEEQAASAQAELAQQAGVLAVMEAQPVSTAEWIPNDPKWNMQYGPQRVQAPQAWSTTTGAATVIIAIIDTGIDLTHPDLAGKIWSNPGEIPGNGIDDDHNGYKDDVRGWDWYNGDNNPSDDHSPGHGSHVAGIAAAASNNSVGIAGMAWNAKLMPLKVLGGNGSGADWAVAEAIMYAARRGARVINLSLAGHGLGSYVRDAVNFAYSRGVVVVAAAGNNGSWGLMEPGSYTNAWGIVATDEGNNRAGYSNFGNEADFAAPGSNIYSTVRGGYQHMSGTSMATPHVAGAAALLASMPRFNTPTRIQSALRLTAADGGSSGWDPYYGFGRIQVARALTISFDPMPPCVKPTCYRVLLPFAVP